MKTVRGEDNLGAATNRGEAVRECVVKLAPLGLLAESRCQDFVASRILAKTHQVTYRNHI